MSTDRADQTGAQEERKLLYRCRRGTRELDCILTGFFELDYKNLDADQRQVFARFLEMEDCFLIDWLCNGHPVHEPQFRQIVKRILIVTGDFLTSE